MSKEIEKIVQEILLTLFVNDMYTEEDYEKAIKLLESDNDE